MFSLSPIYQVIKPQIPKPQNQQIYIKLNIHKHQTQNFRRISPFGITPVKKAHKAEAHAGIVDHSVDLSIPDFRKV